MSTTSSFQSLIATLIQQQTGNENGKPDPVYSVDLHPTEPVLTTSGVDANVPPKGSVRVSLQAAYLLSSNLRFQAKFL